MTKYYAIKADDEFIYTWFDPHFEGDIVETGHLILGNEMGILLESKDEALEIINESKKEDSYSYLFKNEAIPYLKEENIVELEVEFNYKIIKQN